VAWRTDNRTRHWNGISLIIFAGIVARFPNAIFYTYNLVKTGELSIFFVLALVVIMVAVVAGIIFIEEHREEFQFSMQRELLEERCMADIQHIFH